jgi:hypothetical protein
MTITKLVEALVRMAEEMSTFKQTLDEQTKRINQISEVTIGSSLKALAFRDNPTSVEDLKAAIGGLSTLQYQVFLLDIQFANAVAFGLSPEGLGKVQCLLDESKIKYMRTTVEQHQKLDALVKDLELRAATLGSLIDDAKADVGREVLTAVGHVTSRLGTEFTRHKSALDLAGAELTEGIRKQGKIAKNQMEASTRALKYEAQQTLNSLSSKV